MVRNNENLDVDVIIPTYNRGRYIERSINSVLNQTYRNINIYVIDDGSTDNTEEIVRQICDSRVHYYKIKSNCGANYCRNYGIEISNSKYIAFNDSDDMWREDKIEIQMSLIGETNCVVFSPYILNDKYGRKIIGYCNTEDIVDIRKRLLKSNIIGTPTILMTRDIIRKVGGFDEKLPKFQDWEFCIRLSKLARVFYYKEPLVEAYRVTDSITNDKSATIDALKQIAVKYSNEIKKEGVIPNWIDLFVDYELNIDEIDELLDIFKLTVDEKKHEYAAALMRTNYIKTKINEYMELTAHILKNSKRLVAFLGDKKIHRCSIYGNSDLGQALGLFLISEGINIDCFIDKKNFFNSYFSVITPDEYKSKNKFGVIINTVPSIDYEISKEFIENEVITLKDLVLYTEKKPW